MKKNIQRVVKYITSFVGIALALVICVMPVFASEDGIYIPADYEVGSPVTDSHGIITYHYSFTVPPLTRTYFTDVFNADFRVNDFEVVPPSGVQKTTFNVFPLGVYAQSNKPWSTARGVVDVRDFKAYSQFELAAKFDVSFTWPDPTSGTLDVRHYWLVFCYDDTGYPTGTIRTEVQTESFYPVGAGGTTIECGGMIQLPANTAYILPNAYIVLYGPPANGTSRYIVRTTDLYMSFGIDSVLENTLTMNTIKDQLGDISSGIGDLNNKFDDVLSGTPEQNQQAQEDAGNVGNQVNDYYSIMRELEQYEHIDQEWSTTILANFLNSDGYLKVKDLMSPLLNWTPYNTIMLTILALVNLSVILFGR